MGRFILEDAVDKVQNKETRRQLWEVMSCYNNGNYRAAIVTLYTAMIYDLMNKVYILDQFYGFKPAHDLLDQIYKAKKSAPKSPQWEDKLMDGMKEINFVSEEEYGELTNLKTNRNYAAHPIIKFKDAALDSFEMKELTRETALDMIRKAFEIVFLRDPIITTNINQKIEEDMIAYYKVSGLVGMEDYLNTKYISKMNMQTQEMLFKFLWKMSFVKDNGEYRSVYVRSLETLCKSDSKHFAKYLKDHQEFFRAIHPENLDSSLDEATKENALQYRNKIIDFKKNSRLVNLLLFLEKFPDFYDTLDDYIKGILYDAKGKTLRNIYIDARSDIMNLNLKPECPELKSEAADEQIKLFAEHLLPVEDIADHFKRIEVAIRNKGNYKKGYDNLDHWIFDNDMLQRMYVQAEYNGCQEDLSNEFIKWMSAAQSYNEAGCLLSYLKVLKKHFSKENLQLLLREIGENRQYTIGLFVYNQIVASIKDVL